ncbi:unnamed protein product [Lactuca saligna]|uniref:IBH1-like N-terminal domain-containing protein n=1 Tax=Lactuca saligna TaxID=75948 RepID=A0AA35Z985_LACSI|nr:unnamed protein product [Lactuca saligna]
MSSSQQPTSVNPIYLKNQFARRFVRALNNLKNQKGSAHDNQMHRISGRVKIAAYTAMASVVGSRRAWSRAVLSKIKNRPRNLELLRSNRKRAEHRIMTNLPHRHHAKVSIKRRNPNPIRDEVSFNPFKCSGQESKLRKLVPGAGSMDSWCLVDETADYIKCLAAQVQVMQTLVDLYTAT